MRIICTFLHTFFSPHTETYGSTYQNIMSDSNPQARKSKRAILMSSLYELTSNMAEERGLSSNRGVAANTAATLLSMGLSKLEARELENEQSLHLSEEDQELIRRMALSAEELRSQKSKEEGHFVDQFMEKLVDNSTSKTSPDDILLRERVKDPARKEKKPLSIVLLGSNLKRMSQKMSGFFKLQYGITHLLTWRNQPKTLFSLVIYTSVCLWPHLVVCFPLLILLLGVIIPHYLQRHPMNVPEFLPVKKRGQSFFQFFTESQNSSLLSDFLDSDMSPSEDDILSNSSMASSTEYLKSVDSAPLDPHLMSSELSADSLGKSDKTKVIKKQMSLLMNMRDLQNLTSDVLDGMEKGEAFATDFLSFKNERLSTMVFYVVILLTLIVFFLGQFIPWRLLFILAGWGMLGAFHPGAKDAIAALSKGTEHKLATPSEPVIVKPKPQRKFVPDTLEFDNIIVDNEPEIQTVEIYELQAKDIFKHEWTLFAYTKRIYDRKDPVRISGKIPHGVSNLKKVLPPKEWKYDFGYASNWFIDTDPAQFIEIRRLDKTHLEIREKDNEGWIYDNIPVDQENVREFRRRRLYRTCYRYARPVQQIKLA